MILLAAAADIFGFTKQKPWSEFKKTISGEEIRKFYEVQAALWHPDDTNWEEIMPRPDGRLRANNLSIALVQNIRQVIDP